MIERDECLGGAFGRAGISQRQPVARGVKFTPDPGRNRLPASIKNIGARIANRPANRDGGRIYVMWRDRMDTGKGRVFRRAIAVDQGKVRAGGHDFLQVRGA